MPQIAEFRLQGPDDDQGDAAKVDGGFLPEAPEPRPQSGAWGAAPAAAPPPPPPRSVTAVDWAPPPDPDRLEAYPEAGVGGAGCSRCDSLSFNAEWLRAFGVVLCGQCKRQESLISKSTAKQRYSVSDSNLSRLGSLRKANPHQKDWQPMRLYLESQVAAAAHSRHGGAEGLEQYQQSRLDARMEAKLKRKEEEKRRQEKEGERLRRIKQRVLEQSGGGGGGEGRVSAARLSDGEVEEI